MDEYNTHLFGSQKFVPRICHIKKLFYNACIESYLMMIKLRSIELNVYQIADSVCCQACFCCCEIVLGNSTERRL